VGALFSSEMSFTQEMLLWDEGADQGGFGPGRADDADEDPSIASFAGTRIAALGER
jgi:hypothetical protein